MTTVKVPRRPAVENLSLVLDSPEVARLIEGLQATRWTGRPGYPIRTMIGMALAKSMYALPTWTRVVALVHEHPALAAVIAPDGDLPSVSPATASPGSSATTHTCWTGASQRSSGC